MAALKCATPTTRRSFMEIAEDRQRPIPSHYHTFSKVVRKPSRDDASYILSGKRMMNPSRFGIRTFGSVLASIASFSPMSLFDARM